MAERPITEEKRHTLTIGARTATRVEGVCEVISFDEESVELVTVCGELTVEGESLHVSTLDTERGVVVIDGRVSGVLYHDTAPRKQGLRARWFG
ncbi:MAG: sporulation protein YabP [Clostridia bacterium]|nr:sporulation protein YabP [Clostridia bacterium]